MRVPQSGNWEVQPRFLNPQRIELARKRRGLTKTDLAVRLGVNPRTVGAYEKTGAPLTRVSALATQLDFPEEFFAQSDPAELSGSDINFRAGRLATVIHRNAAIATAANAVEIAGWIAGRFVLPQLKLLDLGGNDPRTAARLLRASWGLDAQPLPNMVHLAEYFGIKVYSLPALAEQVDAFSLWSGSTPFIFIARRKTPEQCRFDIAHELGHLVLHRQESVATGQEREADIFASEFLLPQTAIREQLGEHPAVADLLRYKSEFRVSAMLAAVACHKAGGLSDRAYRQLCIELHELGFKHGEPDGLPRHETSKVFPQVFNSERFSVHHAATHLHLPEEEVHGLTFSTALHLVEPQSEPTYYQQRTAFIPELRLVR